MPEETMFLRDAALRLARTRNPKTNRIQSSKLFSALQTGERKAGVYILNGTEWIEIPETYWLGINSNKFRRIARTDDPKSGTYTLRVTEFPGEVARIICNEIRLNEESSRKHQTELASITDVIKATAQQYEVVVKTKEFQQYLQRPGLD